MEEDNKNIGQYWGCIIQSHDGNPHQVMGWPPISCTHVFTYLIKISIADGTYHWWIQRFVLRNKHNVNIMRVGYTNMDAATEAVINKNWCRLDNKSTCNDLINGEYMSNIRDAPDGQYLCVHCNTVVTYTTNIWDLPGYSNPVWYNSKGIANIL